MGRDLEQHPDWVRCVACWAIYAPALTRAECCPKCGGTSWLRTTIPNGDTPLRPPVAKP